MTEAHDRPVDCRALARRLIVSALALYGDEDLGSGLRGPAFAMDSTTIDSCLSPFPWAHFRQTKAAVKVRAVMDLRGAIPAFISIATGKRHDVRPLDEIDLPALTIAAIHENRWQIESFLEWIKQSPAVKHSFGNSINAVKAQIRTAVCAYPPLLTVIEHHRPPLSPRIFPHFAKTNIFEKVASDQLAANAVPSEENQPVRNRSIPLQIDRAAALIDVEPGKVKTITPVPALA